MDARRSVGPLAVAVALALTASLLVLVPLGPADAMPDFPTVKPRLQSIPAVWEDEMDGRPSGDPSVSSDGSAVAFVSTATNLTETVLTPVPRLYVRSNRTVVIDPDGSVAVDPADPVLSANGAVVAFTAQADRSDPGAGRTVYAADVTTGTVTRVEVDPQLVAAAPSISDDGSTVAYQAAPRVAPAAGQIRLWDRRSGITQVVSRAGGVDGNGPSSRPAISGDGRVVAFTTAATNLVSGLGAGDYRGGGATEVVALHRPSGVISLLSSLHGTGSPAPTGDSWVDSAKAVSTDGTYVAFTTSADGTGFDHLLTSDANGAADVVVRDRSGAESWVASSREGQTCTGESTAAAVADDGSVVFASTCTDLTEDVLAPGSDVWGARWRTPALIVSHAGDGVPSRDPEPGIGRPSLSRGGEVAAFSTTRGLTEDWESHHDVNGVSDVYTSVDPGFYVDIQGVEVAAGSIAQACPYPSRSVVRDLPAPVDPASPVQAVDVIEPTLGLALNFELGPEWWWSTAPVEVGDDLLDTVLARAVVLEFDDGAGGSRFLVWDHGFSLFGEMGGLTDTLAASRVAICIPATPDLGPQAFNDTASAFVGTTVEVDVLSNDEGELDRATLQVGATSAGQASVVDRGGNRVISFTAPDDAGIATVGYTVTDVHGTTTGGILTVNVAEVAVSPLTLSIDGGAISPDTDTVVTLGVSNETGAPVSSALVTFATAAPATVVSATGGGWSCATAGDARSTTCTSTSSVDDGAAFPSIAVSVRTPAGPQLPCNPADPAGGACVDVRAWNGDRAGEASADPAPATASLPYQGGVMRVNVADDGPFAVGNLGTYTLAVVNPSPVALPPGAILEVRSDQPDMAFVTGSGEGWSCTADPDDDTRGICVSSVALEPFDVAPLSVIYTVGEGQAAGCPAPTVAPCALLDVNWIDTPAAGLRVPIARHATTVEEAANPIPPDLTVQLTHPSVVWTGQGTSFRAVVTNAGLGPSTGDITAVIELPAGLTAVSVAAQGWSCTVGTPSTTCTRTTPLAAGAHAPTIVLIASVALDATDGIATAAVGTPQDSNPTNNSSNDFVMVRNGDPEAPDGPFRLGVDAVLPDIISPGATVPVDVAMVNYGDSDSTGAVTIGMLLPDGTPVGQELTATQREAGGPWECVNTQLAGIEDVRCTYEGSIEAGGRSPNLALDITVVSAVPGSTVDIVFTHLVDGSPITLVRRMTVVPPRVARLAMTASQPTSLVPGLTANLEVDGRNVGTATPTEDVEAELVLPAGIVAESVDGPDWTCAGVGGGTLSCTNPVRPVPGTAVSPMSVVMRAGEGVEPGSYDATYRVTTVDLSGEHTTEVVVPVSVVPPDAGTLSVSRPDLPAATAQDRSVAYDLVVTNSGETSVDGLLVVTESFPVGTAASGSGDGWSCAQSGTSLVCERSDTQLASMQDAPAVRVEATFAAGLAGGQAQLSAAATIGWASGVGADAVLVTKTVVPAAELQLGVTTNPTTLIRGGGGTARMTVANTGDADLGGPLVVGVVLSRGLVPTSVGGSGWTCAHDGTAAQAVAACRAPAGPAAGASLGEIEVAFDVSTGAADQGVITFGTVEPAASELAPVISKLRGQGGAALAGPVTDVRPVRGLVAEAGPDQKVHERTQAADGTTTPTVVRLDGRGSSAGTAPLSWQWVQTAGPAVTWESPAGTVGAADGTERPYATGATPGFVVPRLIDEVDSHLAFELTATSGDASLTDTVTVTVTPTADLGPVLSPITTNLPQIVTAPADGTQVVLTVTADDPEDDSVSMSWDIASTDGSSASTTIASTGNLLADGTGTATASFEWPAGATYVVVEATGASARGGVSVGSLSIGSAPPPPAISVSGPARVSSGDEVTITATVDSGDPASLIWRWRQLSGPAIDPAILNAATGPELTFDAPAVSTHGQVMELTAVATRVAGASSAAAPAEISVTVDPLPAPAVSIEGDASVAVGAAAALSVVGAPAGSTVAWSQRSGPMSTFSSTTGESTTVTIPTVGVVATEARVTDPTGRVTSATFEVVAGSPVKPGNATSCSSTGSLINAAFAAVGGSGGLSATIGSANVKLGKLAIDSPCGSPNPALTFTDAGFSIAGGSIAGSGLSGRISEQQLCITSGHLTFPSSWGLSAIQLGSGSPLCLGLGAGTANQVTGSFTVTGLPFLKLPTSGPSPVTSVDFNGTTLRVTLAAPLPDQGSVNLDVTVNLTDGTFSGGASGRVVVLGTAVDFSGSLAYDGTTFTFSLDGNVPGPVTIVPGTTMRNLHVHLDRDGVTVEGDVSVDGKVSLQAKGSFSSSTKWSLGLTGQAGAGNWQPMPSLTIGPVGFSGKVERDGGPVSFSVSVDVPGEWAPTPQLRATKLTATLSNLGAPAECPSVNPGSVWLSVEGLGEIVFGEGPDVEISLTVQACIAPSQAAWSIGSKANLDSWEPIPGLSVSVESVGVRAVSQGDGTGVEVSAFGSARAFGATIGAVATYKNGSLVVDASGDVSELPVPLPEGASGHAIFASKPRPNYSFQRPGAIPTIDPNLMAMNIPQGMSVYAGMDLPQDLRDFMTQNLHLPDVSSVVVSVQLGGADPTLEATIGFGDPGMGITLYESCAADCSPDNVTRLSMSQLVLRISTSSFGFKASAKLELPASGSTPRSEIAMSGMLTIGWSPTPSLTAAFEVAGTWHDALGSPGLDLSWFVIQGGVVFGTGIPTPSFGVAATVERLPDDVASAIGVPDTGAQEPMTFAINLSATNPIIEIQIGEADGGIALDPLAQFGVEEVFELDYASLVIAPMGGQIGSKVYRRGMSLGFAVQIAGVEVDAMASVDLATAALHAEVNVGSFSTGGVTVHGVSGTLDVAPLSPTPFAFSLAGSVYLDAFASSGTLAASIDVRLGTGGLRGELEVVADDVSLGGIVAIDHLRLYALVDVGKTKLPDVTFELDAAGDVLGANVAVRGAFEFTGGKIKSFEAAAVLDVDLGVARLTGNGCSSYPALGTGACLAFSATGQSIGAEVDARLEIAGFSVAINGKVDSRTISASGSIDIAGVGAFAISGKIYHAPDSRLGGYVEKDFNGIYRQVRQGDFRFASEAYVTTSFGGFGGAANLTVAKVGDSAGVSSTLWVAVPGGTVNGSTTFGMTGGTVTYDFQATGQLSIASVSLNPVSVRFTKTPTSFSASVAATLAVAFPGLNGSVSVAGSFSSPSGSTPARYDLTGTANINMAGLALNASLRVSSTHGLTFSAYLGAASVFNVTVNGTFTGSGYVNATASVDVVGVGVTIRVMRNANTWSVGASFSYKGHTFAQAAIGPNTFTASIGFSVYESGQLNLAVIIVGGTFQASMQLGVTISRSGGNYSISGHFSASGHVSAWFQHPKCSGIGCIVGKGWHWSSRKGLGNLGISVDSSTGTLCAEIKGKTLCV